MLVFNFLVLTVATYCESKSVSLDNPKTAESTATSNINFVEAIKQDLKRNNDDYKEMIQRNVVLNNKQTHAVIDKKKESINKSVTSLKKGYRRKSVGSDRDYDYGDTIKPFTESPLILKSTDEGLTLFTIRIPQINIQINHSRSNKRHHIIVPKPSRMPNILHPIENLSWRTSSIKNLNLQPPTEVPNFINQNKIDKFQKFMQKNQGLLKKFVSNRQATLTQAPFKKGSMRMPDLELLKPKYTPKGVKNINRFGDKNDGDLPNPDLLDMAPAIGIRVHKKRAKDQLCHRHVLLPEGPKYDSRGRWYLPAHELIAKRPYPATRTPLILLPRCCNCCKKSVLGCE
ncbi:uncharacterized protein LOC124540805 [Vanessa cardui]|uniref:uncharacterized protein LOC124540805 n=1 Tax=Vanessa cardui TaxID=171605 RepID=UPI001F140B9D|nr:uncharacterized protein LOC124540805 [Vanessa cardui]